MLEFKTPISDEERRRLQQTDNQIRPFPTTATKILELCQSPDSSITDLVQLIECEPAIASRMLELTNSPLYGSSRTVKTISSAAVLLGSKTISQLAITLAAGPLFLTGDECVMQYREKVFRESLGSAISCRLLAEETDQADPDEAFLAGVVHDVGKLLFFDVVPDQYVELLQSQETCNTSQAEEIAFGSCHATAGQKCGAKWGLPASLLSAIASHHKPIRDVSPGLPQIVMAGHYFARQWQLGFTEKERAPVDEETEHAFSTVDMADLSALATDQFQAMEAVCLN